MISQRALTAFHPGLRGGDAVAAGRGGRRRDRARGGRGAHAGQHVRTQVASYKRPQRVPFANALARNAGMKVRKDQLRAELTRRALDGTGAED